MISLRKVASLAIALAAMSLIACEKSSTGEPPPPPPPQTTDLLAAVGSMDAAWSTNTMYWNRFANDPGAVSPTAAATTYAGMTGDCLSLTSTNWGTANWHVQLAAGDTTTYNPVVLTLKAGKQYTISFKGAASAAGSIQATLQINGTSTNAAQLDAALTTTTQTFASATAYAPSADTDVKFIFNLGALAADTVVYLDDVQLLEEDAPPPPPPPATTDLLSAVGSMNSAWSTNTMYWNHFANGGGAVDPTTAATTYAGMTGDCLSLTSSNWGTANWHVQLAAGDTTTYNPVVLTLKAGKTYTISFKGAASAAGSIQAILQINGGSSNAAQLDAALTTTTQTFTSATAYAPSADTDVKFMFNLGALAAGTTVYLDDVQLIEQ